MKTLLLHPVYIIGLLFCFGLVLDYLLTRPVDPKVNGPFKALFGGLLYGIAITGLLIIWPIALGIFVSKKLR